MTFPGVRGHERIVERLAKTVARQAPHHAYIFHGPSGVGRRRVAIGFAMALNCEQPTGPGQPCGECGSCRRIAADTDAEVWTVSPTAAGKAGAAGTGARAIRVDDVREIQGRLAFKTQAGRFRLLVIDDCELMTVQAANCLLKSLEEPPDRTVLVLITQRLGQMLPTIRSRCLQVGFYRLPDELIREILLDQAVVEPGQAEQLAAAARGSIGRALEMSAEEAGAEADLVGRFLLTLAEPTAARLELAAEINKLDTEARRAGTPFMRRFLVTAGEVVRDAANPGGNPRRADCAEVVKALASEYDADAMLRLFAALQTARDRLDRNMNTRLILEALLLEDV